MKRNPAFFAGAGSAPSSRGIATVLRAGRATGKLNLSERGLGVLPPELFGLQDADALDTDEKWWECNDVVALDASDNAIAELQPELSMFDTLVTLKLARNRLVAFPDIVLPHLKSLDVSGNKLVALPMSIGSFDALVELIVVDNVLEALPDSVADLYNLEALRCDGNRLRRLPPGLTRCTRLHDLTLSNNALDELPHDLGALTALQLLEARSNRLFGLPPSTAGLTSLTLLDVRENAMQSVPALPATTTLHSLLLGFNKLKALSPAIADSAPELGVLDCSDNAIKVVPDTFGVLTALHTLDLSNNNISDLPFTLGFLTNLKRIALDGNPLRAIRRSLLSAGAEGLKRYLRTRAPEDMTSPGGSGGAGDPVDAWRVARRDAGSSGVLDLSNRGLAIFPMEGFFGGDADALRGVHTVKLAGNSIVDLPEDLVWGCPGVAVAYFDNNKLSPDAVYRVFFWRDLQDLSLAGNTIPMPVMARTLADMQCSATLKTLNLSRTGLTGVPSSLASCTALTSLNLSNNAITSGGDVRWPPHVAHLDLSNNSMTEVPPATLRATHLDYLNLENNNLRDVPAELGRLPALRTLLLGGNPQRKVRQALIREGSAAVLSYLRKWLGDPEGDVPAAPPRRAPSPVRDVPPTYARDSPPPAARGSPPHRSPPRAASPRPPPEDALLPPTGPSHVEVLVLKDKLAGIEADLQRGGHSRPKEFALKKELARVRAAILRAERK